MPDPQTVLKMPTSIWLETAARPYIQGRVLDVGCGSAPYKRLFPDCEWVGLDIRPVAEVVADAHSMPVDDGSFDTVLCTEMLHECPAPLVVMRECVRVLRPGGHLVVTAPNTHMDDDVGLWSIKRRGLDYLFASMGLTGIHLGSSGKLIGNEWGDYQNFSRYAMSFPEIAGWLDQMDDRYPVVTVGVARKDPDGQVRDSA